jgi:lipopolysaccharide/colanic/teichoic acid biosynthesis glycosyltransferase
VSRGEVNAGSHAAVPGKNDDAVRYRQRPSGYQRFLKPVIDRLMGGLLLLLTLPLLAVIAATVRFKLGKPVIYRQERVGKDGETFELYKFRTMMPDRRLDSNGFEGPERRRVHKSQNDPRVLPVAGTLRSWRLDELPQFWNVLNGDMSLVGPRPEMPQIVATYEPWQHRRHVVKPGVTGPWQISSHNGKPMHECTEMDLEYVDDISLRRDLSILARTPMAAFGPRRGY